MQITVCDMCGAKNTYPLSFEYDRVYNGTDYDTPTERYDLCATHLYCLLEFLTRNNSYEANIKIIDYLERTKKAATKCSQ